ncbi:MAG: hypothetical protein NC395_04405 [Prevotella sp.]|nr:hypothetical protein [Prevotella sp.]
MKNWIFLALAFYGLAAAYISSLFYAEALAYVPPAAAMTDMDFLAAKPVSAYTESDFELIREQTGLGRSAVVSLGSYEQLSEYRDRYFGGADFSCTMNSPVSFEERICGAPALLAPLEDGDILVTNCSHVLSWRNGHAAIVVDAENGVTLEAVVIGSNSRTQDISKWTRYPNFAVLRLKNADKKERAEIARSALENLNNIPYKVTIGLFPAKYSELSLAAGTQCAHLVWLAYAAHGYDIDSDHGLIVTPEDILGSDLFERVQVFGMG